MGVITSPVRSMRGPGLQFGTPAAVATRSLLSHVCGLDHAPQAMNGQTGVRLAEGKVSAPQ